MNNMTALVSCFVRAYHTENSNIKVYNDAFASKILTKEEYFNIASNMTSGIKFFNPNYEGDEPLKWIVNNNIGPSVLARAAFNEKHLFNDIKLGLEQYVIIASGYDTIGYKVNKKIKVFELDKKEIIEDKIKRTKNFDNENISYISCDFNENWILDLLNSGYDKNKKTFCSLLGISYYLPKSTFSKTIKLLSDNMPKGSSIIFDYPNEYKETKTEELAKLANEEMKSNYSYDEILKIAELSNMQIYEHLESVHIDNTYFYDYNTLNTIKLKAPKGVSYCLLVK
ncbi:MAG: class I SAM-dependent methyltransferase [Candidatus Faecisoma sp.]|nr:class I SAM-dependent methyltransferase [Acholeplasma sp.]MDY2892874.1 class I SAM-dependent methyltransferase [Candidatus Faecisoma sp.]